MANKYQIVEGYINIDFFSYLNAIQLGGSKMNTFNSKKEYLVAIIKNFYREVYKIIFKIEYGLLFTDYPRGRPYPFL